MVVGTSAHPHDPDASDVTCTDTAVAGISDIPFPSDNENMPTITDQLEMLHLGE